MTTGERILALLPAKSRQLLKAMPMSTSVLHKWLTRLRAAGQVHIGRWRRSVGDFVAVWADDLGARRQVAAQIAARARFDCDPLMAALFGR